MEKINFEEKMDELEKIVSTLENEKVDLEESIKLYEKAKKIASSLEKYLLDANNMIVKIKQDNQEIDYDENKDISEN